MASNQITVTLPPELEAFVEERVASGSTTAEEVARFVTATVLGGASQ